MSNNAQYSIHPAIGIGRVGNSLDSFYLAPETTGGLPFEADGNGNPVLQNNQPVTVSQFKDSLGRVRRRLPSSRSTATCPARRRLPLRSTIRPSPRSNGKSTSPTRRRPGGTTCHCWAT